MFDMMKTARKISSLRKANNMTQMELAEKLNISYQAVSGWERGNSMPDISKLPQLAELFCVTIDELLGESAPLVQHAADGTVEAYCWEHTVTADELSKAAPILKPDQIDTVLEHTTDIRLENLEELIPFLDQKTVDRFAQEAEGPEKLKVIAPFVSESLMDKMFSKFTEQGKNAESLLPFVSSTALNLAAETMLQSGKTKELEALYPFLSSKMLKKALDAAAESDDKEMLENLLPFLQEKDLEESARRFGEIGNFEMLKMFAPFLKDSVLADIIKKKSAK